ncbi:MAG TPA: hypothetical protein VF183_06780 [Acidimicrobiales bacterium]
MLKYRAVLDLVRLTEDRWLARAAATRRDGTTVLLEEVLTSRGLPRIEAVTTVRDDGMWLELRDRDDPSSVLARASLEVPRVRLRVVRAPVDDDLRVDDAPPIDAASIGAASIDGATRLDDPASTAPTPTGPPVPA